VSAERTLKGRKHFSQSVGSMVSAAVSKLGKTDLVFVPPEAKINCVYYCENVLEQGLQPGICRISNNDFVFKQAGWSAMHAIHHTIAYRYSNVPDNSLNQSRSISRGLFSVDCVVGDGVTSQNFRH